MEEKGMVSNYGVFTTIAVTMVAVGVFSFPRDVTKTVGSDGWIVVLISGLICSFFAYIMCKGMMMNGYKDFNKILEDNFGRIFGSGLALIFAVFILFYIGLSMRVFIEVVKVYLLEKTPTEFLIIITIFIANYLIRGEFDALLKFNEISFWIMFVSLFLVLLFTLNKTDFTNVLPIFTRKPGEYLSAIRYTVFSFTGFEVVYMLAPRAKCKAKFAKLIFSGVLFVTIFYMLVFIFVIAVFSQNQTMHLIWPTITMIKSIDIPGSFIQRWEGIVMTLWIVFFFTTFTNVYYFSSDIVKKAFRLNDIRISSFVVMPFLYLVALYPENIARVYDLLRFAVPPTGAVVYVIIPFLVLITGVRKQKRDGSGSAT